MTSYTNVYNSLSKIIWGYLFMYFHINIGTISILPSFVGYILFSSAINLLKDVERELSLLKPFCIILGIWEGIEWLAACVGYSFDGKWQFVTLIAGLLNLYFQFQLITNLASIAKNYQEESCDYDRKLLRYRTIQAILQTVLMISTIFTFIDDGVMYFISMGFAIIFILICIYIMILLGGLKKHLKNDELDVEEDNELDNELQGDR